MGSTNWRRWRRAETTRVKFAVMPMVPFPTGNCSSIPRARLGNMYTRIEIEKVCHRHHPLHPFACETGSTNIILKYDAYWYVRAHTRCVVCAKCMHRIRCDRSLSSRYFIFMLFMRSCARAWFACIKHYANSNEIIKVYMENEFKYRLNILTHDDMFTMLNNICWRTNVAAGIA